MLWLIMNEICLKYFRSQVLYGQYAKNSNIFPVEAKGKGNEMNVLLNLFLKVLICRFLKILWTSRMTGIHLLSKSLYSKIRNTIDIIRFTKWCCNNWYISKYNFFQQIFLKFSRNKWEIVNCSNCDCSKPVF